MEADMRAALATLALVLVGCAPQGVATVQLGNSVLCGPTEVIMPSPAVTTTRRLVGDASYATTVCDAARSIDATGISTPMQAVIELPGGPTTVRVRQNLR
jgi:hypothetical protein